MVLQFKLSKKFILIQKHKSILGNTLPQRIEILRGDVELAYSVQLQDIGIFMVLIFCLLLNIGSVKYS